MNDFFSLHPPKKWYIVAANRWIIVAANPRYIYVRELTVLRQLDRWGWFYVLRQKSDAGVWFDAKSGWQPFGSYIQQPGQSIWLGRGYLTAKQIYPVNLLVHWQIGEPQP